MKTYVGVEELLHTFLTLALDGQLHAPAALSPGKENPVSLDRRLGGSQRQCESGGEKKRIPSLLLSLI
jgi:hypothetical protein